MPCSSSPSDNAAKPLLRWCWPEALAELAGLEMFLRGFAQLRDDGSEMSDLELWVPHLRDAVDAEAIAKLPHLRVIATPSTGTDHIDLAAAAAHGVHVLSLKDDRAFLDGVQSTAELAWMLILACSRNLRACMRMTHDGEWDAMAVRGHELLGGTIGIIGYGRLGSMVGRFANAFGMNVLAADPVPVSDQFVTQLPLPDLLQQAEIISLHVHLNDKTRNLIGPREFSLMRDDAVLVNTSRGGVIDESALLDALRSGRLAAAGLDVITGERDEHLNDHPLLRYAREHENLLLTPHVGGCTEEAQAKAMWFLARKLREFVLSPAFQRGATVS